MDHFSYEVMGKERVRDLREEGMRNQEVHRSGSSKIALLRGLLKLIPALLGILVILGLLVR